MSLLKEMLVKIIHAHRFILETFVNEHLQK